jgi:antitoxin component of RelBE/YafQ-DinJ toxin-antitoxin module
MNWIKNIFANPAKSGLDSPSTGFDEADVRAVPLPLEGHDLLAARQLIHSTAVKAALDYGIPAGWLGMEVLTISGDESAYFQLQICMNQWDEYLWMHSGALSMAIIKIVRQENLPIARAMRAVLWRVAADAGCPFDAMPPSSAWTAEAMDKRARVRERIQMLSNQMAASSEATDPALQGMPNGFDSTEAFSKRDSVFDATNPPSHFNGFAATEPFDPAAAAPQGPAKMH